MISKRLIKAADENSSLEEIEKEIARLQELSKIKKQQIEEQSKKPAVEDKEPAKKKGKYTYIFKSSGEIKAYIDYNNDLDQQDFETGAFIYGDQILEEIYGTSSTDQNISSDVSGDIFNQNGEVTEELKSHDAEFVQYMPDNLKSIVLGVELSHLSLDHEVATVTYKIYTDKVLSEDEEDELEGYMIGQLSDGIGEGFEQQEFETEDYYNSLDFSTFEVENPEYDEEDENSEENIWVELSDDVNVKISYYVSLYGKGDIYFYLAK